MATALLLYAGISVTLAALLLLVMVVQAASAVRLRRDAGVRTGAAPNGVEARQPQVVGSR